MQFQDKVVLVTDAGVAQAFARAGSRVMQADINAEQEQQCLAAIEAEGGQAAFFQVDVTSAAQMRYLLTATVKHGV